MELHQMTAGICRQLCSNLQHAVSCSSTTDQQLQKCCMFTIIFKGKLQWQLDCATQLKQKTEQPHFDRDQNHFQRKFSFHCSYITENTDFARNYGSATLF